MCWSARAKLNNFGAILGVKRDVVSRILHTQIWSNGWNYLSGAKGIHFRGFSPKIANICTHEIFNFVEFLKVNN